MVKINAFRMTIIAIVACSAVVTTACGSGVDDEVAGLERSTFSSENINCIDGVFFTNVNYLYDDELFRCTLVNKTDSTIHYGEQFFLEMCIDDEWFEIPYSNKIPWTYQLNYLLPFSEEEIDIPIGIWEPLSDGVYRLVKAVSLTVGDDASDEPCYVSSLDFAIEH